MRVGKRLREREHRRYTGVSSGKQCRPCITRAGEENRLQTLDATELALLREQRGLPLAYAQLLSLYQLDSLDLLLRLRRQKQAPAAPQARDQNLTPTSDVFRFS